MTTTNSFDLRGQLLSDIYSAFADEGRDIPAEALATRLAHSLSARVAVLPLDPQPWAYYAGDEVIDRSVSWSEDHDAFLPREGYVQDIEKYWGMRPGEQLSLDSEPWLFRGMIRHSARKGNLKPDDYDFVPRPGYNQNRGLYSGQA